MNLILVHESSGWAGDTGPTSGLYPSIHAVGAGSLAGAHASRVPLPALRLLRKRRSGSKARRFSKNVEACRNRAGSLIVNLDTIR